MTRGIDRNRALRRLLVTATAAGAATTMAFGLPAANAGGGPSCHGKRVTIQWTGSSTINGTSGVDVISAANAPYGVTINASSSNDTICGSDFDDLINAGSGNDWIDAGDGEDTVHGESGNDTINGGDGERKIALRQAHAAGCKGGCVPDNLYGESGNDKFFGGNDSNDNNCYGGVGVDGADEDCDVTVSIEYII